MRRQPSGGETHPAPAAIFAILSFAALIVSVAAFVESDASDGDGVDAGSASSDGSDREGVGSDDSERCTAIVFGFIIVLTAVAIALWFTGSRYREDRKTPMRGPASAGPP